MMLTSKQNPPQSYECTHWELLHYFSVLWQLHHYGLIQVRKLTSTHLNRCTIKELKHIKKA